MAKNSDQLIAEVIEREGDYVNHPADRGGPTRWGISEAVARRDGFAGDMRSYPREMAEAIYRRRYWTRPGFDQLAGRSAAIAEELFDTGVNMGPAVAVDFLQRALNVLNRGGTDFPDLLRDGKLGPRTLGVLDTYLEVRGPAGESVMLKALNALQGERYVALCESRPANEAFLFGWLANRLAGTAKAPSTHA